ncbi:MAG: FG-GAP-like repeat-containing protein, partial [Deltaproteobacteria bacterium]|nr:FG-GAP-like repeat-containing protein [Deltaproteobacteria bacterium]
MTERTKISSEATMALLCCVVGSATGCGSDERQPEDPALRAAEEAPAKDSEGLAADEPFAPPQIIPEDEDTSWTVEDGLRIGHWSGRPVAAYDVGYQTSGGSAEEMASEYLHTREDLGELVHVGTHETPGGYHVRYEQRVKGHPVHRSDIVVNLDTHGVVTSVFGDASPELSVDGKGTPIDPNDALAIAKAYLKVAGAAHHEDVQLVVYRYQSRLAYAVTVVPFPTTVQFGEWEVLVDAHSGEIFRVEDQALSASGTGNVFRVDPLTSSGANYYDPGFIHDLDADTPQLTAELFGVTLQDITLAGGQYHLEGPNAVATDFWAPSVPTSQPTNNFQFTRSHDSFEAVSGYYHIDTSMRYAQSLGYNPTPYQYSGGVRFDPRVFMSVPNAYYIGSTGEIWFNGHAYNHPFVNHVETAEDAAWVLHELGHGLHDWLSGGNLSQWEGLSEGVADYWAQSYVHGEGLLPTSDPRFHWFFRWGAHDHVINFNLGRVTNYSAQYPSGLVGQVHTDGQIWSSTLMQIWSDIGKATTDTLLLETLSSVGSSSNQNDAANAFYQADLTLYGGAHIIPICNRLLQRGYTVPACSPHIVETSTGTTGGLMIDTGQTLGSDWGWDAQLADLDGDGDLDAFVCNVNGDPNKIWLNNGTGVFGLAQSLGSSDSRDVGLGDVDGDGDVDAYVINANGQADQLWFNNGAGSFANSGQLLGTQIGLSIDLGDVDGDGDLDALVGNNGPNRIWLNNGS